MTEFQSPSGVLGVCGHYRRKGNHTHDRVSVPFRGFRGLRDTGVSHLRPHSSVVSVPFRGFRGLRAYVASFTYGPSRMEVSVPFRGFRGLRERIAKSSRVVWLPYAPRYLHSSCILVHLFSARHPGITTFPLFPHPVFATRQIPRKWPRVAKGFRTRF